MSRFCERCKRDAAFQVSQEAEDGCPIVAATLAFDEDDPNYPVEWIEDDEGPRCTAYEPLNESEVIRDPRQMDLIAWLSA